MTVRLPPGEATVLGRDGAGRGLSGLPLDDGYGAGPLGGTLGGRSFPRGGGVVSNEAHLLDIMDSQDEDGPSVEEIATPRNTPIIDFDPPIDVDFPVDDDDGGIELILPCPPRSVFVDPFATGWMAGTRTFYDREKHGLHPSQANPLDADQEAAVDAAFNLLWARIGFIGPDVAAAVAAAGASTAISPAPFVLRTGFARLFHLAANAALAAGSAAGQALLDSVSTWLTTAAARVNGTLKTPFLLNANDLANASITVPASFGYGGPLVIGTFDTDDPWRKLLWRPGSDGNPTWLQSFLGSPEEPQAYTFPFNWNYAVSGQGLSVPALLAATGSGFVLPAAIQQKIPDIDEDALDGFPGFLANATIALIIAGASGSYLLNAVSWTSKKGIDDVLAAISEARKQGTPLCEVLAWMLRATSEYQSPNGLIFRIAERLAEVWDSVLVIFQLIGDLVGWDLNSSLALDQSADTHKVTGLTYEESCVVIGLLHNIVGQNWSGLVSRDPQTAVVLSAFQEDESISVPIVHVESCYMNFPVTGFEGNEERTRVQEFQDVLELASAILEQAMLVDEPLLAASGALQSGTTMFSVLMTGQGFSSTGLMKVFAEMTGGLPLQRLFRILWKIDVIDAVVADVVAGQGGLIRADNGLACLYKGLCSFDSQEKRDRIDVVLGPWRDLTNFSSLSIQAQTGDLLLTNLFIDVPLFSTRYFSAGLLGQVLLAPLSYIDIETAWYNLSCGDRRTVQNFFSEQDACCGCHP